MVGHDIRNPLQAVLSDTYLLKDELASMPEGENKEGVVRALIALRETLITLTRLCRTCRTTLDK